MYRRTLSTCYLGWVADSVPPASTHGRPPRRSGTREGAGASDRKVETKTGDRLRSPGHSEQLSLSDVQVFDAVTDAEHRFPLDNLLKCDYFVKYREGYYKARDLNLLNPYRNYVELLTSLSEIYAYNERHARSFAKRITANASDFGQCEAVFAEIVVYRHYIRPIHEDLVRRVELHESEADVIVERPDGSRMFLEVFSVNPDFPIAKRGEKPIAKDVRTHTQHAMASIRQKLLRKIKKQKQMSAPRENYAVIELNNPSIAGDFSVLSSLSGGYKVQLDRRTLRPVSSGYDWGESIFNDPATRFLKGIIYFSLGDYSSRKYLLNPEARRTDHAPLGECFDMDQFLHEAKPRIFDPDGSVTASEGFDVDDFVRTIHEGRDVERKDLSD